MFKTCAFCNAPFDGDGGPSGLGVGRRLAFDEWRGRLWVVCSKCSRWNLTPLDDRLERIESVARAARDERGGSRVVASTEQVALIRWQRYDFVRVGKPLRVELATWRYGERLRTRQRERMKVVLPLTVAAVGLGIAANVAAGGGLGVFVWNLHNVVDQVYIGMRSAPIAARSCSSAPSMSSTRASCPTPMLRSPSSSAARAAAARVLI